MFDTVYHVQDVILRLQLLVVIMLLSQGCHTKGSGNSLSELIADYEPIYYDKHSLIGACCHHRTKRSLDQPLLLQFQAFGRTFRVRLKRDASIYSPDIVVENATSAISFDINRAYTGIIEGDSYSNVYGTIAGDGVFEGQLHATEEDYTVERASRYFKTNSQLVNADVDSIIYRHSSIRLDKLNDTLCLSDVLHHKLSRRAITKTPPSYLNLDSGYARQGQGRRIVAPNVLLNNLPPFFPNSIDPTKTTCTMYLQADHLFYQKFDADENAVIEQLTQHVQAVNDIYRFIDFDGDGIPDSINFIIKRIKVWTSATAPGYRFAGNYGVEAFLELLSEDNFDAFCLAYMFTYRDFDGGTLGLAWTGDLHNAGGVCEKNGQYRGSLKSLNSGIVTILNYGKDVPPSVSHVTMAHEIGHNIGSQHDPETPECSPGGADGNYIMYARATSGDRPNNNKFSSCSKKSMSEVLRLKARGIDGCFIPETSAICGNGIVEGDEECDCGWEDECREECCYPQVASGNPIGIPCTRRQGAVCSPSEGPCCASNCQLISPQSGHVCREQTSCKSASFCDGLSASCPQSVNVPDKTQCEDDSVCFNGECSGSICLAYDLEACQCPAIYENDFSDPQLCQLCCKKPGLHQPCRTSKEWNRDPLYHVPHVSSKPGSPCHNFRGYCDVFLKCREVDPTGPLANLKQLLFTANGIRNIKQWLAVYWYVPSVVAVSLILSIVAVAKLCHYSQQRSRVAKPSASNGLFPAPLNDRHKQTRTSGLFTAFNHRAASDQRGHRNTPWPRCSPCRVGTIIRAVPHQTTPERSARSRDVRGNNAIDGQMLYASWV